MAVMEFVYISTVDFREIKVLARSINHVFRQFAINCVILSGVVSAHVNIYILHFHCFQIFVLANFEYI